MPPTDDDDPLADLGWYGKIRPAAGCFYGLLITAGEVAWVLALFDWWK